MIEKTGHKDVLTPSEIAAFCAQIAMIIKAGISLAEGISIMHDDTDNPVGEEILGIIKEEVEIGAPLYMFEFPHFFSTH